MIWFYAYLAIGVIYGAISLFRGNEALKDGFEEVFRDLDPDGDLFSESTKEFLMTACVFIGTFATALLWVVALPFDLFLSLKK